MAVCHSTGITHHTVHYMTNTLGKSITIKNGQIASNGIEKQPHFLRFTQPRQSPSRFAIFTARRIACAITSAANAPTVETSAFFVPVDSAKITSPSSMVWAGLMVRAMPSCAICATFVAWAFVNFAFVATAPITVLPRLCKTKDSTSNWIFHHRERICK